MLWKMVFGKRAFHFTFGNSWASFLGFFIFLLSLFYLILNLFLFFQGKGSIWVLLACVLGVFWVLFFSSTRFNSRFCVIAKEFFLPKNSRSSPPTRDFANLASISAHAITTRCPRIACPLPVHRPHTARAMLMPCHF